LKTKKKLDPLPSQVSESRPNKPLYSWFSHSKTVTTPPGFYILEHSCPN
jgi:hypothetical protein